MIAPFLKPSEVVDVAVQQLADALLSKDEEQFLKIYKKLEDAKYRRFYHGDDKEYHALQQIHSKLFDILEEHLPQITFEDLQKSRYCFILPRDFESRSETQRRLDWALYYESERFAMAKLKEFQVDLKNMHKFGELLDLMGIIYSYLRKDVEYNDRWLVALHPRLHNYISTLRYEIEIIPDKGLARHETWKKIIHHYVPDETNVFIITPEYSENVQKLEIKNYEIENYNFADFIRYKELNNLVHQWLEEIKKTLTKEQIRMINDNTPFDTVMFFAEHGIEPIKTYYIDGSFNDYANTIRDLINTYPEISEFVYEYFLDDFIDYENLIYKEDSDYEVTFDEYLEEIVFSPYYCDKEVLETLITRIGNKFNNWIEIYKDSDIPQTLMDYIWDTINDNFTDETLDYLESINNTLSDLDYAAIALSFGNELKEYIETDIYIPNFVGSKKAAIIFIDD